MIIQLEIPKEFAKDYVNNRFDDFFRRVYANIDNEGMCGNYEDLGINKKPVRCPPRKWTEDEVETLCRMVDEGYDFTLIAEKLNRTALATRGKYERLQNPEYNKRYNRGQNEDYEYQGIRSISGKDILKDRELMDGAEFQELEPVANK